MAKGRNLKKDTECPICGTKVSNTETQCPECGEMLENVLVLEEEAGGTRALRIAYRVGLVIFLLGFLILIYTYLHEILGSKNILPSLLPGYDAYTVWGPYNQLTMYIGSTVMIIGIIVIIISFVANRFRFRKKKEIEETEVE